VQLDVEDDVREAGKVEVDDTEIVRKRAIADKQRESLALIRSKIQPKSQITKEKDTEIAQMEAENERLRAENAKVLAVKPILWLFEVIKQPVEPVRQRPVRREGEARQEREREASIDDLAHHDLAHQSYAEQLQTPLTDNMLQRIMSHTFM